MGLCSGRTQIELLGSAGPTLRSMLQPGGTGLGHQIRVGNQGSAKISSQVLVLTLVITSSMAKHKNTIVPIV